MTSVTKVTQARFCKVWILSPTDFQQWIAPGKSNFRPLKLGSESLKVCFFSNGAPLISCHAYIFTLEIGVCIRVVLQRSDRFGASLFCPGLCKSWNQYSHLKPGKRSQNLFYFCVLQCLCLLLVLLYDLYILKKFFKFISWIAMCFKGIFLYPFLWPLYEIIMHCCTT